VQLVEEKGAGGSSSNLAAADHSKVGLFSAERWTAYFDVDTAQVLQRIRDAFLKPHEDFMEKTSLSPDLYDKPRQCPPPPLLLHCLKPRLPL